MLHEQFRHHVQASTAVALALCAPSICAMRTLAITCLATAASTKLRYMLMLR